MSTNTTAGDTIRTGKTWILGALAAGLAVIIVLGLLFAVDRADEALAPGPVPAHPTAPGAHRAKAEQLAERAQQDVSPGVNPERHRMQLDDELGQTPAADVDAERLQKQIQQRKR